MQEQTENKQKNSGCLPILIVLVGLGIFGALLGSFASRSSVDKTQQTTLESTITTTKGKIDTSRDSLVNVFKTKGYTFKKNAPIEGQENYVAKYGKGEIQLLGEKDNLSSASFTAYMGVGSDGTLGQSVEAQSEMVLFASAIEKTCKDWLVKHQMEASKNVNNIYNKSELACGRKLTLYYFPGDSMTFGVTPAK